MNQKIKLLHLGCWLTFGLLAACSQSDKNPYHLEDLTSTQLSTAQQLTIVGTKAEASVAWPKSEIYSSDELLLGKFKEDQSAILVKFGSLPSVLDTVTIEKAILYLFPLRKIVGALPQEMTVSAHEVLFSWSEESVVPTDVLGNYDPTPLATATFFHPDSTESDSLLPAISVVQKWVQQPTDNNGLLILPETADHIKIYYSDETSYLPQLVVCYNNHDQIDTVTVYASEALSVVQSNFQLPPDRLMIGSGLGSVCFFQLDYSAIPKYATINRAYMTLKVDTKLSIIPNDSAFLLVQMGAESRDWNTTPMLADSSLQKSTIFYRNSTQFKVELTSMFQQWVNRDKTEYGFRLSPLDLGASLFRCVVYASTVQDSLLRPKLDIFYSLPQGLEP